MDVTPSSRRSFLAILLAAAPALAVRPAHAWSPPSVLNGSGAFTATWTVLEHVTDGTDPSTSVIAPPHFSSEIRKLTGQDIALSGFIQPISSGFGKPKTYLLSRSPFHCPYCYTQGRGSLAVVTIDGHVPSAPDRKVVVRGKLALQETDPSDFYFQLNDAKLMT